MAPENAENAENADDCCAICLQTAELPIVLPCFHKFCFLCAKGAALRDLRCALCRSVIPKEVLLNPRLDQQATTSGRTPDDDEEEDRVVWFYEGRNGWWRYNERNSAEIERAHADELPSLELLLAGNVYVVNFRTMTQYKKSDPSRRRRIKRDFSKSLPVKGVAGVTLYNKSGVDDVSDSFGQLSIGSTSADSRPDADDSNETSV